MSHYTRRVSRSLIVVLVCVIGIGLALHYRHLNTSQASESSPAKGTESIASVGPPSESTPATKPATQESIAAAPATRPAVNVSAAMADAKSKQEVGDLLGARKVLNDALSNGGNLQEVEVDDLKKAITELNQTIIFSQQSFPKDEFSEIYLVQKGDRLQKIAAEHEVPFELLLKINNMTDASKLRAGQKLKVINGPFNVVVTKSKFMMDLYLGPAGEPGGMYVMSFPVGLGRDDSTPTGIWMAEAGRKIKDPTYYSPRGEGVKEANDPNNPLGHRWIGLTGTSGQAVGKMSYGIHGTIDENSIGKQESMGCIRMHNADVAQVFDMLVDGKSVVVVKG